MLESIISAEYTFSDVHVIYKSLQHLFSNKTASILYSYVAGLHWKANLSFIVGLLDLQQVYYSRRII